MFAYSVIYSLICLGVVQRIIDNRAKYEARNKKKQEREKVEFTNKNSSSDNIKLPQVC